MKRLVFAKSVTLRLTPGCNDYTNPNTNPTRPSRQLTWPGGDHRGTFTGGVHRGGKSPGGNNLLRIIRPACRCFHLNEYLYQCTKALQSDRKPWILFCVQGQRQSRIASDFQRTTALLASWKHRWATDTCTTKAMYGAISTRYLNILMWKVSLIIFNT